jgi:hypothetical protein
MTDRHPNIYKEFDLEAARKAGQADEQERIVKLLEWLKGSRVPDKHLGLHFIAIDEAIDWIRLEDD